MYLARNMRPDEIAQWLQFTGKATYEPREVVAFCVHKRGPSFTVLGDDGYPAAAGGYFLIGDGVWQSWMLSTIDGWNHNWLSITKAVRWLMDAMFTLDGVKLLQTYVLAERTKAIEWYTRSLGMQCVQPLPGMANGSDAAVYARAA